MSNVARIDKGVPVPTGHYRKKYPFPDMDVGDSFFVPGATAVNTLASCAAQHKPKRFTARLLEENGVKGVRVWRIS